MSSGKHQLYNNDADKIKNFRNIFLGKNNSEAIFFVKRHDNVNNFTGGNGPGIIIFQLQYKERAIIRSWLKIPTINNDSMVVF